MTKLNIESWDVAFSHFVHYDIMPVDEKYYIQVCLMLNEEPTGDPDKDEVLILPLAKEFDTAQEAFEWIEETGPIFLGFHSEAYVFDTKGDILTEWSLEGMNAEYLESEEEDEVSI